MSFSALRIEVGLSLEEVAAQCGVSAAEAMAWEAGNVRPPQHVYLSLDVLRRVGSRDTGSVVSAETRAPVVPADDGQLPSVSAKRRLKLSKVTDVSPSNLIRSKQRVADHGEVFTPSWLVEKMLDLVKGETERIDSRFLEPACGSGNFLVPILQRKLAAVERKYGKSVFEKRHYALLALTSIYGIELLPDNIADCRANMLEVFANYLGLKEEDELYRAASHVLSLNLIHGDAMTMKDAVGGPIMVVEWGYLGKGKFQRRDFRLDVLTGMSKFREEQSLFAHLGKHEIFQPTGSYPPMIVRELAARDVEAAA